MSVGLGYLVIKQVQQKKTITSSALALPTGHRDVNNNIITKLNNDILLQLINKNNYVFITKFN